MPSFTSYIDFEVYCSTCGAGICNHCDVGKTTKRGMLYIEIRPCDKCNDVLLLEIEDLKDKIKDLEESIEG